MAHDGIGFELFIYLCLDWQTPQEIFHWVFCLCRLKALKMVSCLDVISEHVTYLGEYTEKQTETES